MAVRHLTFQRDKDKPHVNPKPIYVSHAAMSLTRKAPRFAGRLMSVSHPTPHKPQTQHPFPKPYVPAMSPCVQSPCLTLKVLALWIGPVMEPCPLHPMFPCPMSPLSPKRVPMSNPKSVVLWIAHVPVSPCPLIPPMSPKPRVPMSPSLTLKVCRMSG